MRFVLDENIPGHTEDFLVSQGHEIIRQPYESRDKDIMAWAESEKAIVLTRDLDFLNFLPSSLSGIVYIPIHPPIAEEITHAVRRLLNAFTEKSLKGKVFILRTSGVERFR